ncbi:hypothetical protein [Deinococcus sp. UYEF24]
MTPETPIVVPLTLLVIVDNSPDAEDDLHVMHGEVHAEPEGAVWRGVEGRWIPLAPDWRLDLKSVPGGFGDMFSDALHFLPVVIQRLPDNDTGGTPLGWKLPT